MAHQVTITAQTGPARVNTAAVLANVDEIFFDLLNKKVQVTQIGLGGGVKEYDLAPITAVTVTITAGQYAVVIS